jgi:hypothetical protein
VAENFQTVSEGVFSEVHMYGVLASSRQAEGDGIISLVGRASTP